MFCERTEWSGSSMCALSRVHDTIRSSTRRLYAHSYGPRGSATCTCESSEACAMRDAILGIWGGVIARFVDCRQHADLGIRCGVGSAKTACIDVRGSGALALPPFPHRGCADCARNPDRQIDSRVFCPNPGLDIHRYHQAWH
jgi:hypothetical protein